MLLPTDNYTIDLKDKEFVTEDGIRYPQTLVVHFTDSKGISIHQHRYGVADVEAIYQKIENGEDLNLNNTYVKDFSLREYRERHNMKDVDFVDLKNFTAREAFFDCHNELDISYAKFVGEAGNSFQDTHFSDGSISFYKSQFTGGDEDFTSCSFGSGDLNFGFTEFGDGNISFMDCQFGHGTLSFVNAFFGDGKINFRNAKFGEGLTDFHYAKFGKGDVSFDKANFGGGNIDFSKVEFGEGKVDFRKAHFGNGDVSFEESEIKKGRANFRNAHFGSGKVSFKMMDFGGGNAFFDGAELGTGDLIFEEAKVNKLSFHSCRINHFLNLRVKEANLIDLSDTVVRDIIDLQPHDKGTRIDQLQLNGMRNQGTIFIDWHLNNVKQLIKSQEETTEREKADQFRILKESYRTYGKYEDEDKAYVQFKRHELRAEVKEAQEKGPLNALAVYPQSAFKLIVFDKIGLYATNPVRVLFSMAIVYCLFSISYVVLTLLVPAHAGISCGGADNEAISNIALTFYFSAITFFTVGYGDCLPEGYIHFLAPLEGFMGVFLMSYFTVAFVRKILR